MLVLTKGNIRTITETIDKAGISFSHLRDELIDHICCEIENKMQHGLDFQNAFTEIKINTGINDLQKVQEKTLLLIDKNYCKMKKTMKVSGIISTSLLMFASLFKIYHWPFAGPMLVLGFFILCFFFLPSASYVMHKEKKDRSLLLLFSSAFLGSFGYFAGILFKIMHWPGGALLLTIGTGILCLVFLPSLLVYLFKIANNSKEKFIYTLGVVFGICYLFGFLSKIMHWPGAAIMLSTGSVALVVIFMPLLVINKYKNEAKVKSSFIYIISAFTWFVLFSMLITLNVSRSILDDFIKNETSIQKTINITTNKNNKLAKSIQNSELLNSVKQVEDISNELFSYIELLKIEIIKGLDKENLPAIENGNHVNIKKIVGKSNYDVPSMIMLGENNQGRATELKERLILAKQKLMNITKNDKATSELISLCLDTSVPDNLPAWRNKTWEDYYFNQTTVVACMNVLSCLQRDIKLAENEALNYLLVKQSNY